MSPMSSADIFDATTAGVRLRVSTGHELGCDVLKFEVRLRGVVRNFSMTITELRERLEVAGVI